MLEFDAARRPRVHRQRAMTLVEVMLAVTLGVTVAVAVGHVVTQITKGTTNLEQRTQVQTDVAIAMQRIRTELRDATNITALTPSLSGSTYRQITFIHPDIDGNGTPDTIIYSWTGVSGDPVTRQVNGATAESILDSCRLFTVGISLPSMVLTANKPYKVKMEFYENGGNAVAKLSWSSTSQAKQIIPGTRLTPASGTGSGLFGQYYDNMDFTNYKGWRVDAGLNFDWGSASPDVSMGADTFSIRWTGYVLPRYSETYTFYTQSDDGVRLWLDDQLVIDDWTDHAVTEDSGSMTSPIDLVDVAIQAGLANLPVKLSASVQCMNRPYYKGS